MPMRLTILFLLFITVLVSCNKKSEGVEITRDNVKEVLTEYGKQNPENEVTIQTEFGTIKLKLYDDTPLHRANFVKLIKEGTYENAEFYRIFFQFMIQGGIFPKELPYTIPAEFNAKYIHKKGALSMAQSEDDNPNRESSSSEFFIVHGSTYMDYQVENDAHNFKLNLTPEQKQIYQSQGGYMSLDQQYTVFGEVIEGLDVVDKIAATKTYEGDKPLKKIPLQITLGSGK
jgi:cyclophilin family peptidyl-prolyl cis-trans isomerase